MNQIQGLQFVTHATELSQHCSQPKWDGENAKPVGWAQWQQAVAIALMLAKQLPHIGAPEPGADPLGFVWLTWTVRGSSFALQVLPRKYTWNAVFDGTDHPNKSDSMNDVVAAMRVTFPRVTL